MYKYMKYETEPLPLFEFGCIFQACMGQTCNQGEFLNSQTFHHINLRVFVNKQ